MNTDLKITASKHHEAEGRPTAFTLTLGHETVTLDPGKTWIKADAFKWVTRGLMEEPQSFHVLADGTVDVNGEKIGVLDPDGIARLEHEMNKRHAAPVALKKPEAVSSRAAPAEEKPHSDRVQFKIKIDHLGHLMVECHRGSERVETGLRGLPGLIQNGLMIKPRDLHVDPLLRAVEIDGTRFECNETGARQLEQALNARYAARLQSEGETAVEIKENPAASTGFDIRFVTTRAGARFEIKGHLSQDNLDILQDSNRCELLKPGIVLRLSPPFLLIRQRRHDGSEEKIPELPDVQYRHIAAHQLQKILNHRLIRRMSGAAAQDAALEAEQPKEIVALRLEWNPHNKLLLWLKCVTTQSSAEGKAFTHHNVADLQHAGVFRSELDVSLSFDHRTLGVLNKETHHENKITVDSNSSDEDLVKASQMLTAALKPPESKPDKPRVENKHVPDAQKPETPSAAATLVSLHEPGRAALPRSQLSVEVEAQQRPPGSDDLGCAGLSAGEVGSVALAGKDASAPSSALQKTGEEIQAISSVASPSSTPAAEDVQKTGQEESGQPISAEPPLDPAVLALFTETDPLRINLEVFRCLTQRLELPVQDVALSLERVFENRRFQVISSTHPEVTSVLELRSNEFTGFYLSQVNDRKVLLVYARDGKHILWGTIKCELQASVAAESDEFRGSALLGLARNRAGHWVFVVTPEYKSWTKSRAKTYEEAEVKFATVKEIAAAVEEYEIIWPERNPHS